MVALPFIAEFESSPLDMLEAADDCHVCGHAYAPGAQLCRKCEWPRGVPTLGDERALALSQQLQSLVPVAAAIAQIGPLELESLMEARLSIGTQVTSAMDTCEGSVALLSEMLPQAKVRIGKLVSEFHGSPTDSTGISSATTSTSRLSAVSVDSEAWQEDAKKCAICSAKLGKRRLNPRHHCRACGRCVCSKCSPNMVNFNGGQKMLRVCTPCISTAFAGGLSRRGVSDSPRASEAGGSPYRATTDPGYSPCRQISNQAFCYTTP